MIKRLKGSYTGLVLLTVISMVAGLSLVIAPGSVNLWVIRGVGLIWVLEAVGYLLEIIIKYRKI